MSSEARMQESIYAAVREATKPLRRAVDDLSARLEALEASGGPAPAEGAKGPAAGRTAKTVKPQPAVAAGTSPDRTAKS